MHALFNTWRLFAPMNTDFALPPTSGRGHTVSLANYRERTERRSVRHRRTNPVVSERRETSARLDRRGNFLPSVQLVRLVADGLATELREYARSHRDASCKLPGNTELRAFVGEKTGDLLASIGRGVARSGSPAFPLTEQGQLRDVVLLGLRRRIPLNRVDEARFGTVLVADLARCAQQGFQVGSYARVTLLPDGGLALTPLPVAAAAAVEWTRAGAYEL